MGKWKGGDFKSGLRFYLSGLQQKVDGMNWTYYFICLL